MCVCVTLQSVAHQAGKYIVVVKWDWHHRRCWIILWKVSFFSFQSSRIGSFSEPTCSNTCPLSYWWLFFKRLIVLICDSTNSHTYNIEPISVLWFLVRSIVSSWPSICVAKMLAGNISANHWFMSWGSEDGDSFRDDSQATDYCSSLHFSICKCDTTGYF